MSRIVIRNGVPCKASQDGWNVRIWHSDTPAPAEGLKARYGRSGGSGQREITVTPRTVYAAITEDRLHAATCDGFGNDFGVDVDLAAMEEKAEANRARAGSRARQQCRHKIKHGDFSQLVTMTYRENMKDFDRIRRDTAALVRKLRVLIPGFRAVYAFETQARGAWHCHMVVDRIPVMLQRNGVKVKSFDAVRSVWRSIVGADNGNVDVDGHRKRGKQHADQKKSSLAKMAGYVSKYLTKDYGEGVFGRNMWSSTQGLASPPPICLQLPDCPMLEAMTLAFDVLPGHRVAVFALNHFKDRFVLYTEPGP